MITKIDIKKFGLFENYNWDSEIGKSEKFKRVNIIYGRNYSGKTTLSRILKCIEDKKLHSKYQDSNFTIEFSDGTYITQSNLLSSVNGFNIRVYNSDFVKEHLSWLHNDDGTINPFTILGAKNVEIDKKIKEIDLKLGSVEDENGLLYQQNQSDLIFRSQNKAFEQKSNDLAEKLKNKAKDIKNKAKIYNYPTYQINTIKGDIEKAQKQGALLLNEIEEKHKLLKEEPKSSIERFKESKPHFNNYYNIVNDLLKKKIQPSVPIIELVNDSLIQEWVRQGIDKHKGIRENCGFCGNPIDSALWSKLDAHFSKESEDVRKEIKNEIDQLDQVKINLNDFFNFNKEDFYLSNFSRVEDIQKQWNTTAKTYSKSIDSLISELKEREKDIFKERKLIEISDVSQTVLETLQEANRLIDDHNKKTTTLFEDQQKARNELRYSEVAKFLVDIDYPEKVSEIAHFEKSSKNAKISLGLLNKDIYLLNEEKRTLEAQSKDESKGAELVNQHLTHFFGHNELKLVAEGDASNIRFRIVRDEKYANNLSEGECSLISFCYFIAKMEDELKDEINSNKLIIYIDDPISSLDSNHIFFMFSLIESIIAKPKKYCQLFISTHNLDFLKYLKQLTFPKYKSNDEGKKEKLDRKHFLIERKTKSKIVLKLAPEYLRNYITEFNYLFFQIYNCSISDSGKIGHDYQYNFGNNMRKFLEAYLFYKYPSSNMSSEQRIQKFFGSDVISCNLVRRVINEYSHLGENFDRGLEPVDVDAIQKVSQAVMSKIKSTDIEQFEALLESVKNDS